MRNPLGRFNQAAQHTLEAAFEEAAKRSEGAVGTETLLLALATADNTTAGLLTRAGGDAAALQRVILATRSPGPRHDHERLLETLGIDLVEVRLQAKQTFGSDAVVRASSQVRPSRPRRRLWTWISCSNPPGEPRRASPLAGQVLELIPRVERLLSHAERAARPRLASPSHLLLALITGKEPACEILDALGVNLDALVGATMHSINEGGAAGKRAS
jgi:ATP-dependent Clp protease ATP-binding subunit ClpA